jgi:hypothetical protein
MFDAAILFYQPESAGFGFAGSLRDFAMTAR